MTSRARGLTMPEVLVAIAIMAIAVFPLIRAFSQSYGLASKQAFQEQALKIGEAVLAKLLAVRFEMLDQPSGVAVVPFEVIHPSGTLNGTLELAGSPALGSGSLDTGKVTYRIETRTTREYAGPAGGPQALMFSYVLPMPPPPPAPPFPPVPTLATYSCPDPFLKLEVTVSYAEGLPVKLATFRADLRR